MIMRRISCFLMLAAMFYGHCAAAAQDRKAGLNLAYNEFSAVLGFPVKEGESLRLSLNLDMTGVIPGEYLYPGLSAEVAYLFVEWDKVFESGEKMEFYAGPGANIGYVRNMDRRYGIMVALSGCAGIEYYFNVPVSLSLTIEPSLGLHVSRDSSGNMNMDFYKAGLLYSVCPHIGIKYSF